MANYSYKETNKGNDDESWIASLQHISPTSLASSHYSDIHFTKPKDLIASTLAAPHVTFVSQNGQKRNHWYISNGNGKWVVVTQDDSPPQGQKKIAENVVDDAVSLNWIREAVPLKPKTDDDGWTQVIKKPKGKDKFRF